jgi:hypothetical protein
MLFRELGSGDPTPTCERWTTELVRDTLISERAGVVDGYASFYTLREAGHVRNLVVSPTARNAGVGAELMRAVADSLRARGLAEWHLNVLRENAPAITLYRDKLGMELEHSSSVVRIAWQAVSTLPAEPATALPVAPEEEDDIERALGLLSGRIAMVRKREDRVLVQLRDGACAPIGFAGFDPALGSMPFRVARPALAATLLSALRPHARGDQIQVVIEDDAALSALLCGAGAEVRRELLHYRGAL